MFPFWVEVSAELLVQVALAGLTGLACLVQSLILSR